MPSDCDIFKFHTPPQVPSPSPQWKCTMVSLLCSIYYYQGFIVKCYFSRLVYFVKRGFPKVWVLSLIILQCMWPLKTIFVRNYSKSVWIVEYTLYTLRKIIGKPLTFLLSGNSPFKTMEIIEFLLSIKIKLVFLNMFSSCISPILSIINKHFSKHHICCVLLYNTL